jgi:hypothetical protein
VIASIIFRSRAGGWYATSFVLLALVSAVLSSRSLKINLTQQYPPIAMTMPELCAVILTSVGVVVLRPQLWIIDRLGVRARRWIPSVGAWALGLLGPQVVLTVSAGLGLPFDGWSRAAANTLVLGGGAYLVSPFIGPLAASGVVLMLYFGLMCALQMDPAIWPWSPLVCSTGPDGKWIFAVAAVGASLLIVVRTLGSRMRVWARDIDLG